MSNNLLTITIPTYNRNAILKKNLQTLLPQTKNNCEVIVIDNHSEIPVEETLKEELKEYPNLSVVRNKANVGLSGNLIKCFEICETEWVWLIGDDDKTLSNAVDTVSEYITKYPNAHYINFTSDLVDRNPKIIRQQDFEAIGPNEFIEKVDDFSNVIFLSVGIYKMDKIREHIRFAYLFSYTLCPHTALLLASLRKDSQILFAFNNIVERYVIGVDDKDNTWSQLFFRLSIPTLFEIPIDLDKNNKNKWVKIIIENIGRPVRVLSEVIMYLHKKDKDELNFLFNQINHRLIPFKMNFFWHLEFYFCKIILNIPLFSNMFFNMNVRVRTKKDKVISDTDMFSRI